MKAFLRISASGSLFLAASIAVCLLLAAMLAAAQPASAQTAQAPAAAAPPEKVEQLIKLLDDPQVKSWLATKSAPPDDSAEQAAAAQISSWDEAIRGHLVALRQAFPHIPGEAMNAARMIRTDISDRGFSTIILLFGALLALGLGAEWLFGRAIRGPHGKEEFRTNVPSGALRLLSELAPVVVFSVVSVGAFLLFEWPALLRLIILTYLAAVIVVRVIARVAVALLAPESGVIGPEASGSQRLIPVDGAAATFWYRRLVIFFSYLMVGWATVSLLPHLGFSDDATSLIAYLLGIGLLVLGIEIVWRRPSSRSAAAGNNIANWLLSVYLVGLWGLWIAGLTGTLWLGIYALLLPKVMSIAGQAAESLAVRPDKMGSAYSVSTVLIIRGARALVVLAAVLWLGYVLRLHAGTMMQDNAMVGRILRGLLGGAVILLVADLIWHLAKAYIDRNLELASGNEAVSPEEEARRGRLRTLLPILRNLLRVLIAVVAVLMVLAGLGVQIGPLIAGAGIFGVAIGFGSQTLVKDVLSGVFYMLDDAFRVGEYIQSGSYKGTVESFSLRSVRLRHQRGPVFTVPFGVLGAVQNMSRDWVIEKMTVGVTYDTDIDLARRLIKKVGQELAQDPQFAADTIEPLKMQGIDNFGDFAIVLRMKLMTKPGAQYGIKRKALMMIKTVFDENGIKIAVPTVQVSGGDEATAAAAAETLRKRKSAKAIAPAA